MSCDMVMCACHVTWLCVHVMGHGYVCMSCDMIGPMGVTIVQTDLTPSTYKIETNM